MALGTFVAGRYSSTYNSTDLGITKDGYRLTFQQKAQQINKSDAYADMLIDYIMRGGDWNLQADSMEYKAGPLTQFAPWMATLGTAEAVMGTLASGNALALVMTVTPNTAAALNGSAINTLTATKAIIDPNANIALMFDSTLREFPVRLQLLPVLVSSNLVHFSTT